MKHFIIRCAVLFAFGLPSQAQTEDNNMFNHMSVGVSVGTTGLGIDLAMPVGNYVQLRGGINFFPKVKANVEVDYNDNLSPDVAEYANTVISAYGIPPTVKIQGKPNLFTGKLLADIYPFKNAAFFITAGAYFGGSNIINIVNTDNLIGVYRYNQDVIGYNDKYGLELKQIGLEMGDHLLTVDKEGNVKGEIKVQKVRPYVGLGFGRAVPRKSIGCMIELGCQFWGSPEVYCNGDLLTESNVKNEDGGEILKTISKIKVYPVLNFRICGKIF